MQNKAVTKSFSKKNSLLKKLILSLIPKEEKPKKIHQNENPLTIWYLKSRKRCHFTDMIIICLWKSCNVCDGIANAQDCSQYIFFFFYNKAWRKLKRIENEDSLWRGGGGVYLEKSNLEMSPSTASRNSSLYSSGLMEYPCLSIHSPKRKSAKKNCYIYNRRLPVSKKVSDFFHLDEQFLFLKKKNLEIYISIYKKIYIYI